MNEHNRNPIVKNHADAGLCVKELWSRAGGTYICPARARKDGYCKRHHPEAEARRKKAAEQRQLEQSRARAVVRNLDAARAGVVTAALSWYGSKKENFGRDLITPQDQVLFGAVLKLLEVQKAKGTP
jgi:hypothetical protein